jgi:Transcriptional regulator, AbiEi antitoxin
MPQPPHPEVQRFVHPSPGQRVAPGESEHLDQPVQRLIRPLPVQSVTPTREATAAIRELAERQHGVVAWRQLIALGLGRGQIEDRVSGGKLLTLHRGVFALGHRRIGIHGRWLAAVLACGPSAVLSYGSAAQLWAIRGSRGPIEVTRRSGHRRPHGIRLHQTRSLPPEHVTIEAEIPITTPERTLLDLAARLDPIQMERAVVAADRAGCISWPELSQVVEEGRGRKGRSMLRRLCTQVDPNAVDARSNPEIDFLALCRQAGLPTPQVNVLVEERLVDFL